MKRREKISQTDAAYIVLKETDRSLSPNEIVREIQKRRLVDFSNIIDLRKAIEGRMSEEIRRLGIESRFIRVKPGKYSARKFPDFTFIGAISFVLAYESKPLSAREIADRIIELNIFRNDLDLFVEAINARVIADIEAKGEESVFIKTSGGEFMLGRFPGSDFFPKSWETKPLSPDKGLGTDRILVFRKSLIDEIGYFHGVRKNYLDYAKELLENGKAFYIDRLEAENTTVHKQVVSCIILKYQNKLLRFVLGNIEVKQTYFYGHYSIDFGGKVRESDRNLFSIGDNDMGYSYSISRNLSERFGIQSLEEISNKSNIVGVLNDTSTRQGENRLAFIHLVELISPDFVEKAAQIKGLSFVNISEISKEFGVYDYWSKLCLIASFNDELNIRCYIQPGRNSKLSKESEIVLLAGCISSGKTEIGEFLENKYGYTLIRCSKVLKELLGYKSSDTVTRLNMQDEGLEFVNTPGGHEKFAKKIISRMNESSGQKFILDGLRFKETHEAVEVILDKKIPVIYIDSMEDYLYQNYLAREKIQISFPEFLEIIHHPVERAIEEFRFIADLEIYNYGTTISLLSNVKSYYANHL